MVKIWGVVFEGGHSFDQSKPLPTNQVEVDIEPYLPKMVTNFMTRKDGFYFVGCILLPLTMLTAL